MNNAKVDSLKHSNPSLPQTSETDWQILGELQLPVGSNSDDTIHAWLMEILSPLQLRMTFLSKILQSAKETAARILHSENAIKFKYIRFLVFAPRNQLSKGQIWGFFRIEKVEFARSFQHLPDCVVEFYLYLEGQ